MSKTLAGTGPSYIALGGALVPTGQPPALHPVTGKVLAPGEPHTASMANAADTAGAGARAGPKAGSAAADTADTGRFDTTTAGDSACKTKPPSQASDESAVDDATEAAAVVCSTELGNTLIGHTPHCTPVDGGSPAAFFAAAAFAGAKTGMLFQMGNQGLGYYADALPAEIDSGCKASVVDSACNPSMAGKQPSGICSRAASDLQTPDVSVAVSADSTASCTEGGSGGLSSKASSVKSTTLPNGAAALSAGHKEVKKLTDDDKGSVLAEADGQAKGEGSGARGGWGSKAGHYWGQALQYLDRSIQVGWISIAAMLAPIHPCPSDPRQDHEPHKPY